MSGVIDSRKKQLIVDRQTNQDLSVFISTWWKYMAFTFWISSYSSRKQNSFWKHYLNDNYKQRVPSSL